MIGVTDRTAYVKVQREVTGWNNGQTDRQTDRLIINMPTHSVRTVMCKPQLKHDDSFDERSLTALKR